MASVGGFATDKKKSKEREVERVELVITGCGILGDGDARWNGWWLLGAEFLKITQF